MVESISPVLVPCMIQKGTYVSNFITPTETEVNVWDEGPDSASSIRIDPKKGVVAATFNKLVEKLTSERDHGEEMRV